MYSTRGRAQRLSSRRQSVWGIFATSQRVLTAAADACTFPTMLYSKLLFLVVAILSVSAVSAAPKESVPCLAEDYAELNCALALFARARATVRACTGPMLISVVLSNLAAQTPRAVRAAATRSRATGTLRSVIPNPTLRPLRTAHARPPCIPPRFPAERSARWSAPRSRRRRSSKLRRKWQHIEWCESWTGRIGRCGD